LPVHYKLIFNYFCGSCTINTKKKNNSLTSNLKSMLKKQYLKSSAHCKVTFSLPRAAAPDAREIKILGDFNGWNWEQGVVMKAGKKDYQAVVKLETGRRYQFRYIVDGSSWLNDWQADEYLPNEFGADNSVVQLEAIATPKATPANGKSKTTAKKATTKKPASEKSKIHAKDNLKKIEGIGPKIEGLLQDAGIRTFEELAGARISTLRDVLQAAGPRFKMHNPATWSEQAKLAAAGKWDKLEALQKQLKGGRRK